MLNSKGIAKTIKRLEEIEAEMQFYINKGKNESTNLGAHRNLTNTLFQEYNKEILDLHGINKIGLENRISGLVYGQGIFKESPKCGAFFNALYKSLFFEIRSLKEQIDIIVEAEKKKKNILRKEKKKEAKPIQINSWNEVTGWVEDNHISLRHKSTSYYPENMGKNSFEYNLSKKTANEGSGWSFGELEEIYFKKKNSKVENVKIESNDPEIDELIQNNQQNIINTNLKNKRSKLLTAISRMNNNIQEIFVSKDKTKPIITLKEGNSFINAIEIQIYFKDLT